MATYPSAQGNTPVGMRVAPGPGTPKPVGSPPPVLVAEERGLAGRHRGQDLSGCAVDKGRWVTPLRRHDGGQRAQCGGVSDQAHGDLAREAQRQRRRIVKAQHRPAHRLHDDVVPVVGRVGAGRPEPADTHHTAPERVALHAPTGQLPGVGLDHQVRPADRGGHHGAVPVCVRVGLHAVLVGPEVQGQSITGAPTGVDRRRTRPAGPPLRPGRVDANDVRAEIGEELAAVCGRHTITQLDDGQAIECGAHLTPVRSVLAATLTPPSRDG